jgi:class 3 adenylate cyclase
MLAIAREHSVVRRAVLTSIVVGTVLLVINHFAALRALDVGGSFWWQAVLTYAVPYVVSTVASVGAIRHGRAEAEGLRHELVSVERFPDQNPHPVFRVDDDGVLAYANPACGSLLEELGMGPAEPLPAPLLADLRSAASITPPGRVEMAVGLRTFSLLPVHVADLGMNVYGTDVTAAKVVDRFPDRNPNPVLRITEAGLLDYANEAAAPLTRAMGIGPRDRLPSTILRDLRDALGGVPEPVELHGEGRTFRLDAVAVPEFGVVNVYGTDVTAAKWMTKFPDQNPNPVMRISYEGVLQYGNPASLLVTKGLEVEVGDPLPSEVFSRLRSIAEDGSAETIEIDCDGRIVALLSVAVPESGFINLYGTDVTAAKAITKFPDQNPNPVLRVGQDGTLLYGNPASDLVRKAFRTEIGAPLPTEVFARMQEILRSGSGETMEVDSDGRLFSLLIVSVYEFGFINVYGTDITAAREVEVAHRENERLLLNILPPTIAQRLRDGESRIADHFDEMTVLFADVVGFTQLSARLSPPALIDVLNEVFSIFDGLADRHRLEKIKTIGDAYMVVGGLTPDVTDHAVRVADMALEMIEGLEQAQERWGEDVNIRVGMHTGPAVAGVIGVKKFIYDVWGDTVNMASRMESHGVPGRIQVSDHTFERLRDTFDFEPRGVIDVKGKGELATYFLVGRSDQG